MLAVLAQNAPGAAQSPLQIPEVDWSALTPLLVLLGGAALILMVSALVPRRLPTTLWTAMTVATGVVSIATAVALWNDVTDLEHGPILTIKDAVMADGFAVFLTVVIAASVVVTALLADGYLKREEITGPELYALLLLSAAGGVVMAIANDLIVMFIGLEILSIAVYVLAAMHARKAEAQEAGLKYFILGAFASGFFLYGIALVFGATSTTNIVGIANLGFQVRELPGDSPGLLLGGMAFMLVGLGFKVSAAPFHSWAPDVYQGAPSPVVAYMASGVKVAGFAGLLRVFVSAFAGLNADWSWMLYALAVATLVVGAVLAVVQTDVKRMLAYSSVSHAGFMLIGVQAYNFTGLEAVFFYLASYTFMVGGSFGVITVLSRKGDTATSLADFKGLGKREPLLAFVFALFLFAQAGVPMTSGFVAKFYVLNAAVEADAWSLALIAMISAVVSAYLYLRIVVAMYMGDDEVADEPRTVVPMGAKLALGLCLAVTLVAGFFPATVTKPARDAGIYSGIGMVLDEQPKLSAPAQP